MISATTGSMSSPPPWGLRHEPCRSRSEEGVAGGVAKLGSRGAPVVANVRAERAADSVAATTPAVKSVVPLSGTSAPPAGPKKTW